MSILYKLIMAELLWKNRLVCAALEDEYIKREVYKPNLQEVFTSKIFKKIILCYVNESGETNYRYQITVFY